MCVVRGIESERACEVADQHQGTLLIVEDEDELRFILATHLRATGFEVIEAADGGTGLELATQQQPDLIIMDIGLPVLDGIAANATCRPTIAPRISLLSC